MSGAAPAVIPVCVVLPPRTLLLDVAGPLEVLRKANLEQARIRFEVSYVAPRATVESSIGLTIAALAPLPEQLPDDAMVLLAGSAGSVLGKEAEAPDGVGEAEIVAWLRRMVRPGHTLISICSGALLAARAGLLDGYACTTHHACCAELAEIAPKARVLDNRLYVEDRARLTSAGITTGIDLMLHLVARLTSPTVAAAIARYLVVYARRGGADPQLSPWLEGRNHLHPAVHRVQDAIVADPSHGWTLEELARIAVASPRHVSRLFNEHTGTSITAYVNRLRIALAQELIVETRLDMERVAERAGFNSPRQLRRAWGRVNASPPSKARSRASG